MSQSSHESKLSSSIPAYLIKVNTSAFSYKKPSLLHKTKEEYVPKYWVKMRMDQKIVGPSCEDRLSELTTSQIDRIINMQKIRSALHDRKRKTKQTFFSFTAKNSDHHSNVYQANFLAKINHIAIKRNIRHEAFQGFADNSGEQNSQTDKKMAPAPFKYRKEYESDLESPLRNSRSHHAEDDDQKSIDSIQDDLQQFEKNLKNHNKDRKSLRERRKTQYNGGIRKRWFYGLSNNLIEQPDVKVEEKSQLNRSRCVDIEGEIAHLKDRKTHRKGKSCGFGHTKSSSSHNSVKEKGSQEPLQKFRPSKIITLF